MAEIGVKEALHICGVNMRVLAKDAGLSYHQVRRWAAGLREPRRANVIRIAAGLRQRADELVNLASRLEGSDSSPSNHS